VPILLAELGLRFVYVHWKPLYTPQTLRQQYLQFDSSLFLRQIFPQKEQTVPGWGTEWHINERGYRGKSFDVKKKPGDTRIVFLGGSEVFDMNAIEGKDWPHLVEDKLKEMNQPNVEIINAGIPALATFDALGYLYSEIHTFEPDYVILYGSWNDIKYFTLENTLLREYKPRGTDYRFHYVGVIDSLLCEYSQIYVKTRNRYVLWQQAYDQDQALLSEFDHKNVEQYSLLVKLFVDCARNMNASPILMNQARLVTRTSDAEAQKKIKYDLVRLDHEALCKAFDACDQVIHDIGKEKKVNVIDVTPQLNGRTDLFIDQSHFNTEGAAIMSDLTAKALNSILIERQNKIPAVNAID
jgi:lysophospholipase L1-like esterase